MAIRDRIGGVQIGGRRSLTLAATASGKEKSPLEKCRHPSVLGADPMNLWKHYHNAQTVTDALQVLAEAPGRACLIAGGTDLMLDLQQGNHPPVHTLVDVTAIPEMTALEIREGELFIGASVPHARITTSPLVREHAAALATACGLIGGPQVRNTATLGGNVGHALPAADGTIALTALDAEAEVASLGGRRRVPMDELFLGPGESSLEARRELLVGFYLPLRGPNQASAFKRVMRPQGVAIAILNAAVWLQCDDGRITDVHIALGPSGPVPRRLRNAESVLRDQPYDEVVVGQAVKALLEESSFRTSRHRSTQAYRHHMAGILLEETLALAWQAARERISR